MVAKHAIKKKHAFDFSAIEEMDPSLGKSFGLHFLKSLQVSYQKRCMNTPNMNLLVYYYS